MRAFLKPNIDRRGRIVRGAGAICFLSAAAVIAPRSWWLAGMFAASGIFMGIEALRGWCALRACGIKTRL